MTESETQANNQEILNNEPVVEKPRFVYSGKNAERDLEISYKQAKISFGDYTAAIDS